MTYQEKLRAKLKILEAELKIRERTKNQSKKGYDRCHFSLDGNS